MEIRKQSARGRVGAIKPAGFTLVKVLSNMREQNRRATEDRSRFVLGAREMMVLGRLVNAWKDVVGLQLAHKTCPTRLIRGCLYLAVADSQWMQTLVFLKARIIDKLNQLFPDMKITEVIGRPGEIPEAVEELLADADWPDWKKEAAHAFPVEDAELGKLLERCQRKLDARLRGLRQKGFDLCRNCEATVTDSPDRICAVCVFAGREQNRAQVRSLIKDMPWLTLDELHEFDSQLDSVELSALRLEMLEDSLGFIRELAMELAAEFNEESFRQMKKEMVRSVMLYTGCMPDEVDLDHLHPEQLPDSDWTAYLAMEAGEIQC
ncbi:MAG: hypothetical protein CVV41_07520 [Candidatus Riflebacteria bacterium HGW-Riflebacteria-1]|jgi:ribosomal protein S14|nr:MAG: hypothetical protein CVV41_07520 [Candidatus Riflebacteria bacterium HGW-Riflebacteria-1]